MSATEILAYVSSVFLTLAALLGLHKEWKEYRAWSRWFLLFAIVVVWVTNIVLTNLSVKEARLSQQRSQEIAELQRANAAKTEEIAQLNRTIAREQIRFAEELRAKNEQIANLNRRTAALVTGGDSFCYMTLTLAGGELDTPDMVFVHQGKYPLYDVSIRIVDLEKWDLLRGNLSMPELAKTETRLNLGNLGSGKALVLGKWKLPASDRQRYNIFTSARNGFWTQLLRLRRVGGRWKMATKVLRSDDRREVTLFEQVDKEFPRERGGQVNWE